MSYTQSPLKVKSSVNNFGGMAADGNRDAMPYAGSFVTQDATASPVTSPTTVNTTATLTVPQAAVRCTLCSVTNAVYISEDSTYSVYYSQPAATPITIDCTRQQYIYLKASSSTVVSFLFEVM